jgi:hypothetical protein
MYYLMRKTSLRARQELGGYGKRDGVNVTRR